MSISGRSLTTALVWYNVRGITGGDMTTMSAAVLDRLAEEVDRLPVPERLWLLERLVHSLRRDALSRVTASDAELAAMAADPAIQRELSEIDREFSAAEADGLPEEC